MSGGQHRVDEVTRTESRGLDRKNNPRIAAHRPPKETAGLRNAGVCAKGTKKESNTLDVADLVRDVANRAYHYLSQSEIGGSIKGDVNKKTSPSAGSREIFCLDIQPTVADSPSIAREVLLWLALPFPRFIFSSGDNARRLLKLGKRFNSVATMVLSEARGLSLFLVLRGGIA